MLFGSINFHKPIIQQYDIKNNQWESISIDLPHHTRFLSATSIFNGQMILISEFISYTEPTNYPKNPSIYIYEVKTQNIRKSKINFPLPNHHLIYSFNDQLKDILTIYGWLNSQIQNFPTCLTAMITKYYTNEFLHIITTVGTHYKIDILQIIDNC